MNTTGTLTKAKNDIKRSRRHWPSSADHWGGPALRWEQALRRAEAGEYRFSPVTGVRNRAGEVHYVWNAEDSLVLKWLCGQLKARLPAMPLCAHLEGNGGVYGARSRADAAIRAGASFHFRTDVKGYYASIDHFRMMDMVARHVKDPRLLRLVWGVLRRVQDMDGDLRRPVSGLPRSCPVSPLLGGLYLRQLDDRIAGMPGVTYVRYMDDILILADRRCHFRRAVKALNQEFAALGLEKHPDKTSMGRLTRCTFTFLQRRFGVGGMEEPQHKPGTRRRIPTIDWDCHAPLLRFEWVRRDRHDPQRDILCVRRQVFQANLGHVTGVCQTGVAQRVKALGQPPLADYGLGVRGGRCASGCGALLKPARGHGRLLAKRAISEPSGGAVALEVCDETVFSWSHDSAGNSGRRVLLAPGDGAGASGIRRDLPGARIDIAAWRGNKAPPSRNRGMIRRVECMAAGDDCPSVRIMRETPPAGPEDRRLRRCLRIRGAGLIRKKHPRDDPLSLYGLSPGWDRAWARPSQRAFCGARSWRSAAMSRGPARIDCQSENAERHAEPGLRERDVLNDPSGCLCSLTLTNAKEMDVRSCYSFMILFLLVVLSPRTGFAGPADTGAGPMPDVSLQPVVPSKAERMYTAQEVRDTVFAAEKGDAVAQYRLGSMYFFGDGLVTSYADAVKWYFRSSEQGLSLAQNSLGLMYYQGLGVKKDYGIASHYFRLAAKQGLDLAQHNLGIMYALGQGMTQNDAEAAKLFRMAADQGGPSSQTVIGVAHALGRGVDKDFEKAVEWFRKAAAQGYAVAQCNLGIMCETGQGVAVDHAEAVKCYRLAAEQGYAQALTLLGLAYVRGLGAERDYAAAVGCFLLAAGRGAAVAQRLLGNAYACGEGVPRDFETAYVWYSLAGGQGDAGALEAKKTIASQLTPAQILNAEDRVRALKAPGLWPLVRE